MQEPVTLAIITLVLFVASIAAFLVAISKKNMILFYLALLLFFASTGIGLFAGFKFVGKSYGKISRMVNMRTGKEIYASLFDGNPAKCTQVLEALDQVLPKIDVAIYLHFKTCSKEIERILAQHNYKQELISIKQIDKIDRDGLEWFKPENLGDSLFVYQYQKDNSGNGQTLYIF